MKRLGRLVILLALLGGVVCAGAYLFLALPRPEVCPLQLAAQDGGSWSQAAGMPTGRSEVAAAVLDGKIYVAGGLRLTGASRAFERYDPAAGSWQEAAPLPVALHHAGLAAAAGRLYVSGGFQGNNLSDAGSAVWAYDPGSDSWSEVASMPDGRAAHAAVTVEEKLYVVGGVGVGSTFLWVYDPANDAWDTLPEMLPTPREHLAATSLDGKLYVVGGRRGDGSNLAALEIYDLATGRWTVGPDMLTARGGLTAATLDGRIHVTGGEDFTRSPNCTFAQHEVYDPAAGDWLALAPLPSSRHGLASVAVDGEWYVIGGGRKAAALTLISSSNLVEVFAPGL